MKKGAIPLAGNVHIDKFALSVVHTYCWCGHFGEFQVCEMEMRSFGLTQIYFRSALSSKRCPYPCEHRQLRMADISMLRMLDAEQACPADSIRTRNSVARCGRHLAPRISAQAEQSSCGEGGGGGGHGNASLHHTSAGEAAEVWGSNRNSVVNLAFASEGQHVNSVKKA